MHDMLEKQIMDFVAGGRQILSLDGDYAAEAENGTDKVDFHLILSRGQQILDDRQPLPALG